MKAISLDTSKFYIWTPKALTGYDMKPVNNLLLEISNNKILSLKSVRKDEIPAGISRHNNFFCPDDDITLLPCLIDAHVHIAINGKHDYGNSSGAGRESERLLLSKIKKNLDAFTEQGIWKVRDGGDRRGDNLQVRDLINNGTIRGPLLTSTGEALRKHGGYGSFLGNGYSSGKELPAKLDRLLASGINQLKVLASGIVSFREYGRVNLSQISADELDYIITRAHNAGIKVMAHASSAPAVDMCIKAGVDSIEHGYFLNKESLKTMAHREIIWVPTIIPVAAQVREPLVFEKNNEEIDVIKRTYEHQMENLLFAGKEGVPLGVGTDSGASGINHGVNLVEEMLLYAGAGLSNRNILRSALTVNAKALCIDDNRGSIEADKKTCLIGVKGDPTVDLNVLKQIKWLFYTGSFPFNHSRQETH